MGSTIHDVISRPEYNFLRTNPRLGGNILFLTYGGSHAYGTNNEESDIDIRGCALQQKSDLLGLSSFEQVLDSETDTTVYAFNKLVSLMASCNPNTIELLGCRPEHYTMVHPLGRILLDSRQMFLSREACHSFGGYANQQLRRMQNALARDNYPQQEKEQHILGSITAAMRDFQDRYEAFPEGSIKLVIGDSPREDLETEIFADVTLRHYPLRDYKNIWSEMNEIVKNYGKLNKRNRKKDDAHFNKHAMHLVRLYHMCLDILEKEQINTYRESDHELLMSIRNGAYMKDDGSYRLEFFEMISDLEKRLAYAKANTALPQKPDWKRIEEFVVMVNEKVVRNEVSIPQAAK